jgi:hypothetical protein
MSLRKVTESVWPLPAPKTAKPSRAIARTLEQGEASQHGEKKNAAKCPREQANPCRDRCQ